MHLVYPPLYYYMRNFCNLIILEQWYFSLIWNTYMWKLQFRNITRGIYAKYHYKSWYCRYKFCITIVFDFFPGDRNTQKKFKTMVMQNLGGKQGALWSMRKWCIALNDFTGEGCNHLITKNNAWQKCWPIRAPHSHKRDLKTKTNDRVASRLAMGLKPFQYSGQIYSREWSLALF